MKYIEFCEMILKKNYIKLYININIYMKYKFWGLYICARIMCIAIIKFRVGQLTYLLVIVLTKLGK